MRVGNLEGREGSPGARHGGEDEPAVAPDRSDEIPGVEDRVGGSGSAADDGDLVDDRTRDDFAYAQAATQHLAATKRDCPTATSVPPFCRGRGCARRPFVRATPIAVEHDTEIRGQNGEIGIPARR